VSKIIVIVLTQKDSEVVTLLAMTGLYVTKIRQQKRGNGASF